MRYLHLIGNLATQDMSRDLASDVEKLLRTSNPYIRKKAVLATVCVPLYFTMYTSIK